MNFDFRFFSSFFFFIFSLLIWSGGHIEGDTNGSSHRMRHTSTMQEDASDLESAAAMKIVSPDSDDYKLVFISSDSSSKEDDLEDSSSTSSSTNNNRHSISLDDCDWDYFEPSAATTAKTIFRDFSHSPDAHRRRVAANISPLDSPLFYRRGVNVTDSCLRRHRLRESDTGTDEELLAQPESSSPTSSDGFVDIRRNLSRFKRTFRHTVNKSTVCGSDAAKKCDCGHQPQYVPIPVPVPILLPLSAFQNWQPSDLLMTTTDEDDEAAPARTQQLRAIQKKQAAELFQLWNSAAPDLILKQQHGQQQSAAHNNNHEHHQRSNECRVESKMHENHKKATATVAAAMATAAVAHEDEDAARMQATTTTNAVNDLAMHTVRRVDGREQQCDEHKSTSVEKQTPTNDVVVTNSLSKSTMTDDKNRNCTLADMSVCGAPIVDASTDNNNKQSKCVDLSLGSDKNNLQIVSAIDEKPSNGGSETTTMTVTTTATTAIVAEAIDHERQPLHASEVASIATTNTISDLPVEPLANKFRGIGTAVDSSSNNKNRVRKQQPRGTTTTTSTYMAIGDDTSESECVSSSDDDNGGSIHRNYDVAGASRRAEGVSSDDARSPSSSARECQSSSAAEATDTTDNELNHRRPKSKGFYKVFVVNKRNGASSESDSCSSNVNSTDDSSDNDTDTERDCGIVLNYVKLLPENDEEEIVAGSASESIDGDENGLSNDSDEIVLCSIKQLADDDAFVDVVVAAAAGDKSVDDDDVVKHEQVKENQSIYLEMAVDAASENESNVNECNDEPHTRNEEVDLDVQSIATIECNEEEGSSSSGEDGDDASSLSRSPDVSIETNCIDDAELETAAAVEEVAAMNASHSMETAEHEVNNSFDTADEERHQNETVMPESNGQKSPIAIDQQPNEHVEQDDDDREEKEEEEETNAKHFDETFIVNVNELSTVTEGDEECETEKQREAKEEEEPKRTIKGKNRFEIEFLRQQQIVF